MTEDFKLQIYKLKCIKTSRILLRPVQEGDAVALNAAVLRTQKDLQRWMPWAQDTSLQSTMDFVKSALHTWEKQTFKNFPMTALHRETHTIIGATGFNDQSMPLEYMYEIGYWIDKKYQGQGLATEYVAALTQYATHALRAKQIQISIQQENTKSIAVAERCGYVFAKVLKGHSIDCITHSPKDSLIFIYDRETQRPNFDVTWENKL